MGRASGHARVRTLLACSQPAPSAPCERWYGSEQLNQMIRSGGPCQHATGLREGRRPRARPAHSTARETRERHTSSITGKQTRSSGSLSHRCA
eukprot:5015055-Prymnesium_polylepis.1